MPQTVINLLEAIEIHTEYGNLLKRLSQLGNCLRQMLTEQVSVGETSQDIMVGHESDAGLRNPAFRDVLIGCDPAPVVHRLMRQCQRPGVFLVQHRFGRTIRYQTDLLRHEMLGEFQRYPRGLGD